jgi:hypothetical protein
MRTTFLAHLLAVALLAIQPPLAIFDGRCAEVHEIPRFVLERVELPYGAARDCLQQSSRGPSCPALGVPGAPEHAGTARSCLPGD